MTENQDEIGLYFAWIGLYTQCLIFPSVTGLLSMAVQLFTSVDDNPTTIYYSVYFAAWSILFLARWRREEVELSYLWGNDEYGGTEPCRADFHGQHVYNRARPRSTLSCARSIVVALHGSGVLSKLLLTGQRQFGDMSSEVISPHYCTLTAVQSGPV